MHKEFLYIQPVESVNWLLHTLYTQSAFGKCTDIIKNCAEQFSLNDIDYHLYCLSLIHRLDGCTGQSLSHLYKCLEHNNKSADILKQIAKSLVRSFQLYRFYIRACRVHDYNFIDVRIWMTWFTVKYSLYLNKNGI
ncbi:Bardet-Biedl syndrome 4 protein, partial [Schistosoma japonicum]